MSEHISKNDTNVTSLTRRNGSQEISPVDPSIHVFHTAEKPFCPDRQCECHRNQAQIAQLLKAVWAGEMTLYEAVNYADGKTI